MTVNPSGWRPSSPANEQGESATVTGNRIVKAFNTELWEVLRFKKAAQRLLRANLRSVRIQSISSPLMDTIGAIAIALMLLIGRIQIQEHRMTMGMFAAFIILAVAACALYFGPFGPTGKPDPTIIQTVPKPDYFFLWLYALLSLLPPSLETPALLIGPVVVIAGLLLLPFRNSEQFCCLILRPR